MLQQQQLFDCEPICVASEPSINASEAIEYTFMIICCPAKSYYGNQKIKVKIEEK